MHLSTLAKNFEKLFREQTNKLKDVFVYRLYDTMFIQASNIADFIGYKKPNLYVVECKTCQTKSLPFKNIAEHQITDALEAEKVKGVKAYIIVWYYNHDICKAFRTSYIYSLIQAGKKSVSSEDTNGILIPGVKRKKYYDWDWSVLFK